MLKICLTSCLVKNKIFNEDCLDTISNREINYDYVFFSPPDYDELGLTPIKDDEKYFGWMREIYSKLNPNKNVVTIVVSNRRYKRLTIPKHEYVTQIMKQLGYKLLNEKIKLLEEDLALTEDKAKLVKPSWYENKWLYFGYGTVLSYAVTTLINQMDDAIKIF